MTPACAHPQGARTSHSLCRPSPKSAGSPSIRQWKRTSQLTWKRSSQQHAYSIFAPKRLASSLVGRSPQRPMYVGATLPCVANIEAISGVIATYTFSSWRAFMLYPKAGKFVNLHFPWIYIFARIYIPNLRKLKGKCKFYIFPKNVVFRWKIKDFCKNENFPIFLKTKN